MKTVIYGLCLLISFGVLSCKRTSNENDMRDQQGSGSHESAILKQDEDVVDEEIKAGGVDGAKAEKPNEALKASGADCRRDAECSDGFCDSAIGYKCSKRCEADNECKAHDQIEGEFCRPDGRCASKVFVSVWEINDFGKKYDSDDDDGDDDDDVVVEAKRLVLPYTGEGACDFDVIWDWREGEDAAMQWQRAEHISDCNDSERMTHVYAESGEYTVKIRGVYEGFGHKTLEDALPCWELKPFVVKKIVWWGPVGLGARAFACTDVDFAAPDIPDASKMHDLSQFFSISSFNQPLEKWDVSNVSNMSGMFHGSRAFNQPLEAWDVSKVTDMSEMFAKNSAFNQPLEKWDVSKVTDMSQMFAENTAFNQPLEAWDVSEVTLMSGMFLENTAFNQPLEKWNVGKVTNMSQMFYENKAFNQPLEKWDVSKLSNMSRMFYGNKAFNQPLEKWNVSKLTDMSKIFARNQGVSKESFCALKLNPVFKEKELGLEEKYGCQ